MGLASVTARLLQREALLALLVLALAFLNFGHASAAFAAGGRIVVTATSLCGDAGAAPAGDHFACHACRPNTTALPPQPCVFEPAERIVASVGYGSTGFLMPILAIVLGGNPRAPPAA
jgi:hypothetical protein